MTWPKIWSQTFEKNFILVIFWKMSSNFVKMNFRAIPRPVVHAPKWGQQFHAKKGLLSACHFLPQPFLCSQWHLKNAKKNIVPQGIEPVISQLPVHWLNHLATGSNMLYVWRQVLKDCFQYRGFRALYVVNQLEVMWLRFWCQAIFPHNFYSGKMCTFWYLE